MKTSPDGRALIEAFEGRFLKAYRDSVGILTIGFGHTSAAGEPRVTRELTITAEEADQILAADLAKVEAQVSRIITKPLNQAQFDALVSFTFNLGPTNLNNSTLARRVNRGDYDVASEFMKWDKAGGKRLPGLTRRRKAEALMWNGDVQGALNLAN
jgi:lysozyme